VWVATVQLLTYSTKQLDAESSKDVEEQKEEKPEVANLRQSLHHRVE